MLKKFLFICTVANSNPMYPMEYDIVKHTNYFPLKIASVYFSSKKKKKLINVQTQLLPVSDY